MKIFKSIILDEFQKNDFRLLLGLFSTKINGHAPKFLTIPIKNIDLL